MPILSDPERAESFADAMRTAPAGVQFNVTKAVLQGLHDAIDTVMDGLFPQINSAIQAEDSNWNTLNTPTKKWFWWHVVNKRFFKGVS